MVALVTQDRARALNDPDWEKKLLEMRCTIKAMLSIGNSLPS